MEIDFLKLILLTAIHETAEEQRHKFLSELQIFIQQEIARLPRRITSLYGAVIQDKETNS